MLTTVAKHCESVHFGAVNADLTTLLKRVLVPVPVLLTNFARLLGPKLKVTPISLSVTVSLVLERAHLL